MLSSLPPRRSARYMPAPERAIVAAWSDAQWAAWLTAHPGDAPMDVLKEDRAHDAHRAALGYATVNLYTKDELRTWMCSHLRRTVHESDVSWICIPETYIEIENDRCIIQKDGDARMLICLRRDTATVTRVNAMSNA